MRHVIIVGGGASGIIAAISAARCGAKVTLLEQKDRVGKKILSTGNGRCNLTNTHMDSTCFRGDDTSIVPEVLQLFGAKDTLTFFEELGVVWKERQGYVYPFSDQASTILDVLRIELCKLNVDEYTQECVTDISKQGESFIVTTNTTQYRGDAVILATGGKAAPVLGSNGKGYDLAKCFGHHISPVVPALVQLKARGTYFKQLTGIRAQAKVSLYVENQLQASDTGELQLTNYGISGIPVFQISRFAAKACYNRQPVVAEVDFIPHMTEDEFGHFIEQRITQQSHKTAEEFMIGLLHKKLGNVLLKEAQIPPNILIKDVYKEKISNLISLCKHFKIEIDGTNDFDQAQVCAGGVKTTEVSPKSLESNFEKNLYIVGELLDVDGICGGYNLQWAWATGHIAGEAAAKG